jgi:cytochrome bd-type quinol oxidase subunit 2
MGEAGFIFWGVIVILLCIIVGYTAWLWWVERDDRIPPAGR